MEKAFLEKVRTALLAHLEDDKFGVKELSKEIGLSKSQLLRRIKASTGKTVTEFIRETRLAEAARLLQETDLTASEISYAVGFSSPSYFNRCFHDHYGVTPGEYKNNDSQESEEQSESRWDIQTSGSDKTINESSRNVGKSALILAAAFISITALFLHFNFFRGDSSATHHNKEFAIAVLPFLDLSHSGNSDYLTDGITEAITLELSKNKSIRVISRGSAMAFKDSIKTYGEIAKALDVNLLLEGSVLFDDDSLSVIAQLIQPFPAEKHLWAGNFTMKFENILSLVEEISTSIAREINLAVLPEDQDIHNYPVHPEAYDLYLRGRHLWNRETPESAFSALDYLKRSIAIDSNFAPAYATLAEVYILMNRFNQKSEEKAQNIHLGKEAIDKALEKGPYLAEAYVTKGNILEKFDWDWDGMREMTAKGLDLDPNNSYAHTQMSKYYLYKNNMSRSIEEALIAEKLDPLNARAGRIVAEQYFNDRQYERAMEQFHKVLELHPDDPFTYNEMGVLQWYMGDTEAARTTFTSFQELMKNHSMVEKFENSGFYESVNFWLKRAKVKEPLYCSNPTQIAMVSQFMNQPEDALVYLEAAYAQRDGDLPTMLCKPVFEPLYDEPRFRDLLAKTGVSVSMSLKP